MTKMIVFDIDGTLADFYGVPNWLAYLEAQDATPYRVAQPLMDMDTLVSLLLTLQEQGWKIAVTSWLSKTSTRAFDSRVRSAKYAWLNNQLHGFHFDEIHIVKYGTPKSKMTKGKADFQILFDDEQRNRDEWKNGAAYDVTNILQVLDSLLEK